MSNLSSFVGPSTIDTATVSTNSASVFLNGVLCINVSDIPGLGAYCEGGHIICKASSTAWIVAPRCAEVSRTWYLRENANTLANTCTSCTGWFVPTVTQLQNPGYTCRTYWDLFSSTNYWSSTELSVNDANVVCFTNGSAFNGLGKNCTWCVRAFRCVTY